MRDWKLRLLEKKDNEAIAKIIRQVLTEFKANRPGTVFTDPTTDDLYSIFLNDRSMYSVAEQDGEIMGGGGIYPTEGLPEGYCELVKLYLLAETRGKGIGKALIEQCFSTAKHYGFTHIYLESMPELSGAISIYQKLGFKPIDAPLGNSGHFGCDIWMVKSLE